MSRDVPVVAQAIGAAEAYTTVTLISRVEGQIAQVHIEPGADVKAGQILFSIDSSEYEAVLSQAQATLQRDQALAKNARFIADRTAAAFARNAADETENETAQRNAASLEAVVAADQAAVDSARLRVEWCQIKSPIDGRAGDVLLDQGNVVKANEGPLVVINQIKPIYVDFAVPEQYLDQLHALMAAEPLKVSVSAPDSASPPSEGTLTFVDNKVDLATGMVALKATFPNDNASLWPGQFLNASLRVTTIPNAVTIPAVAIQNSQSGTFVFIVDEHDIAQVQPVTTGYRNGDDVVVEQGLQVGARVVTDGQMRLVPGARVSIRQPVMAALEPGDADH